MQFDSLTFVVFFIAVLFLYNIARSWSTKKTLLLVSSYLFYSAWNPVFLPLLIFSSSIDWWLALKMSQSESNKKRKLYLITIVAINLSVLFYFKYINFFISAANDLMSALGITFAPYEFNIILPLGISFYTFHSLSYCIDIYRKKFEPTDSWRDYSLYVAFFPQLVAGPIVRWTQMREQIEIPRVTSTENMAVGLLLLLLGLFEKIVLADGIFAPVANQAFSLQAPSSQEAWIGAIAFTGQIFCDFAGYSTCAIGAALCLGFKLPTNFRNPYSAIGFSDFWQRWHISLSTWLRDYLYIPLGGNRQGTLLTYRNLLLTMLIGGLWHGAAWTFLVWGALHGLFLIIERLLKNLSGIFNVIPGFLVNSVAWLITLVAVMYAWVWFRADSLGQAISFTHSMLDIKSLLVLEVGVEVQARLALYTFVAVLIIQLAFKNKLFQEVIFRLNSIALVLLITFLMLSIVLSPGGSNAFIYFQF